MDKTDLFIQHTEELVFLLHDVDVKDCFGNLELVGGEEAAKGLVGCRFVDLLSPEHVEAFARLEKQVTSGENPAAIVVMLQLDDGRRIPLRIRLVLCGETDQERLLLATDATQELRMERRLERSKKMEALGTLAGGIAHDFNNILMGVIGYADMARDETREGGDLHRYLDHVLTGSYRARDLVRQLLNFTHRSTSAQKGEVPLNTLIKGIGKSLKSSAPAGVEVGYSIDEKTVLLGCNAEEAENLLVSICDMLIDQARGDSGKLTLVLGSKTVDKENSLVADMGLVAGDYSVVQTILELADEKPVDYGQAIGSVFDSATALGGAILMGKDEHETPCICVWLPQRKANTTVKVADAPRKPVKGQGRILVVDDEKMLASMVQRMLTGLGYETSAFTDSSEALAAFKTQPDAFDLVITDHFMPGMNGIELATQMLEIRPELSIIMLTGYSEKVTPRQAEAVGVKRYLLKPIERHELSKIIHEVMDQAQGGDVS
jgi:two-component system cell cycle sensor histidine kinase/response regulator CckA